jgi:hypothetical protein
VPSGPVLVADHFEHSRAGSPAGTTFGTSIVNRGLPAKHAPHHFADAIAAFDDIVGPGDEAGAGFVQRDGTRCPRSRRHSSAVQYLQTLEPVDVVAAAADARGAGARIPVLTRGLLVPDAGASRDRERLV